MAEPERRRRRLRPPSTAAAAPAVPAADETPADETERMPAPVYKPRPPAISAMTGPVAEPGAPATASSEGLPATDPGASSATDSAGAESAGVAPAERVQRPPRSAARRPTSGAGAGGDEREAERGLRGLVGSGSSQVSVGAAMRARDAARPTAEQVADAEENLPIVRRNWMPREELPRNR